ncbi:PAS domain S-box protein [Aromatoleum sp.]|uniref:PAS domain S-box protein n=1 Tax=Aromatoleum sp. TaxID=2307007 RepID=UPI002FC73E14
MAESEERFRKIAEPMQDALIIADRHAAISHWNHAAERMFGYPSDKALGRQFDALLVVPSRRTAFEHWWERLRNVESDAGPRLELPLRRKEGNELPVELSCRLRRSTTAGMRSPASATSPTAGTRMRCARNSTRSSNPPTMRSSARTSTG